MANENGPFINVDLTASELLETALYLERSGIEFYRMIADDLDEPELEAFFRELVEMETEHELELRNLIEKHGTESRGKRGFDDTMTGREYFVYLRSLSVTRVFPQGFEVFSRLDEFERPGQAYPLAREIEENSIKLYEFLASFNLDEKAEKVIQGLLQDEKKHLQRIKKICDAHETDSCE